MIRPVLFEAMKVLLVVGGALLMLLAFFLFIAAVIAFVVGRSRRSKVPPSSMPNVLQPLPVAAPSVAVVPPPPPPSAEAPATVMLDTRRAQVWGALHGTAGIMAGRVFPIDADGFYIGRDPNASQVVIDSPSVSKRHLWVGVREGVVTAVDQSTNGTFLNSLQNRITEARLSDGDTLIISDDVARLVYRLVDR